MCQPAVFDAGACGLDGDLTSVCRPCPGGPGTVGLVTSAQDASRWLRARGGWRSTVCKYYCNSSTSSNPDEQAYAGEPCVSCAAQVRAAQATACRGGAQFFDAAAQACGASAIDVYAPTCSPCVARMPGIVFGGHAAALSNDDCLGLCDPQARLPFPVCFFSFAESQPQVYFTLLANGSRAVDLVPQGSIAQCKLCSDEHVVGCNSTQCVDGYYRRQGLLGGVRGLKNSHGGGRNGSECVACNAGACGAGLFRCELDENGDYWGRLTGRQDAVQERGARGHGVRRVRRAAAVQRLGGRDGGGVAVAAGLAIASRARRRGLRGVCRRSST